MMIAYDFLPWMWNVLDFNKDICFKNIECKHKTFGNINKFIKKCIKITLNMDGVRVFKVVLVDVDVKVNNTFVKSDID